MHFLVSLRAHDNGPVRVSERMTGYEWLVGPKSAIVFARLFRRDGFKVSRIWKRGDKALYSVGD